MATILKIQNIIIIINNHVDKIMKKIIIIIIIIISEYFIFQVCNNNISSLPSKTRHSYSCGIKKGAVIF